MPRKISEDESIQLAAEISKEEIKREILAMSNDKSSGIDGLPVEFYKVFIDWICEDLHRVYMEDLAKGSLGHDTNQGLIKLLPKEGDKTLVKNWRPITLLNVSYKVLAKVLAMRLTNILPKFINSTQTGFIKGRYILENLITSWETLDWAKRSQQNVTMLLLDFEKAYDRVEWSFLKMALEAFGFPQGFIRMISTLLNDASAMIDVNGARLEAIKLERSIRQGCPIAPALFFIASDALHYLLRDNSVSPKVRGVYLPDNNELLNIQFADDTSIFLDLDEEKFNRLLTKLYFFYLASGAKVSKAKSILLGWLENPPSWLQKFDLKWGGPQK